MTHHLSPLQNQPVESYFLQQILRLALAGMLIILISDIAYPETASFILTIDLVITAAVGLAFVTLMRGNIFVAILVAALPTLCAMTYEGIASPNGSSAIVAFFALGLLHSVTLSGKKMYCMHLLTLAGLVTVITFQLLDPPYYHRNGTWDVVSSAIVYLVLYGMIGYGAALLKRRYDEAMHALNGTNETLIRKNQEIEHQNIELTEHQQALQAFNEQLERIVKQRTQMIQDQNTQIIKYAFSTAHHIRSSVARILGLINVAELDEQTNHATLIDEIKLQTEGLDETVKRISRELEAEYSWMRPN